MLLPLPFLKEGCDLEELPLFASVATGIGVLAAVWWLVTWGAPVFRTLGLVILALPLSVHLLLVVTLSKNWLTARAEASRARIVSLRESPIRWPRIDDPVGLRLDIELEHTMSPRGILYPPQVRMDGPEVPSPKGYFGTRGRSALGVSPWRQPDAAPPPSPARLVYELYPPAVMLLSAGEWICLEESPILDVPCTDGGYHLGAIWFAARAAGASVDLSELLTGALREASSFEGRPSTWCAMLERLTPAALEAAGYRRCTVRWKQSEIKSCYCVPR